MFDHVMLRASDQAASERFYRLLLGAVGFEVTDTHHANGYVSWGDFAVAEPSEEHPVTRNLHLAFSVPTRGHVDEFWQAGTDAGYPDAGAPGLREYSPSCYGGFLLDPDGNSVEAVHRDGRRTDGIVDHLWIRVADLAAAARCYDALVGHVPIQRMRDDDDRVSYTRSGPGGGDFSLVADGAPRTEHVQLAFSAADRTAVDAFHAAAVSAGCTDNGAPGPRPGYGPGSYGAFVLDPDGHDIGAVARSSGRRCSIETP